MITWSIVLQKAREAGVDITEINKNGCLLGYRIGAREVRSFNNGWFDEAKVDEVIRSQK